MTREEFDEFMDGEQWTAAQREQFARMTPVGTPDVVHNEMRRPDGCIEVIPYRIPTESTAVKWICDRFGWFSGGFARL